MGDGMGLSGAEMAEERQQAGTVVTVDVFGSGAALRHHIDLVTQHHGHVWREMCRQLAEALQDRKMGRMLVGPCLEVRQRLPPSQGGRLDLRSSREVDVELADAETS